MKIILKKYFQIEYICIPWASLGILFEFLVIAGYICTHKMYKLVLKDALLRMYSLIVI